MGDVDEVASRVTCFSSTVLAPELTVVLVLGAVGSVRAGAGGVLTDDDEVSPTETTGAA